MADLAEIYGARLQALQHVATELQTRISQVLRDTPHIDRIAFRVKAVGSFVAKAHGRRNGHAYSHPLVEIEDQVAGRIIVFFRSDIVRVRTDLLKHLHAIEVVERRPERDQDFGYQSDHLVVALPVWSLPRAWREIEDPPTTCEIQLRTIFMHAYAEPQHDFAYKGAHELPADIRRELAWVAASAWGADGALERVRSTLESASTPPTLPAA